MRLAAVPLLLAVLSSGALAAEPGITITPVQVISQAKVPAGAPDKAKKIMFTEGFSIGYLVAGKDLIGFAEDSLRIDAIRTRDGKDLAKKRNGEPAWEMGSFPEASDDGAFAFFTLECDEPAFGQVEGLAISGTITVLTASDLATVETKAHELKGKAADQAGEFTVTYGAGGGMSFGNGEDAGPSITLTGPLAKITKVMLVVDGAETKSNSNWGAQGTDSRTYGFEKVAGTTGSVRISYWKDLRETPVAFGAK